MGLDNLEIDDDPAGITGTGLVELVASYEDVVEKAEAVVAAWEKKDLAKCVRELDAAIKILRGDQEGSDARKK